MLGPISWDNIDILKRQTKPWIGMQRVRRKDAIKFAFSRLSEPVLTVEPREKFVIETEDAWVGRIRRPEDSPTKNLLGDLMDVFPPKANPLAGPIFLKEAEKGDTLVIDIHDIIPDSQGFNSILPGIGPLSDSAKWYECHGPFTHIIKHLPGPSQTTSDGKAVIGKKVMWDLKPFLGCIATAPEVEVLSSVTGQGPWGGNIDVRDICKGNKILLPVNCPGALLYIGDAHASQADSEFCGIADETRAEVTLSCEVIKKKTIPFARIETKDSLIQLSVYRPLEEAVMKAFLWMMDWIHSDYGVSQREAYMHMSINPNVRIHVYQMVAIGMLQYTVGVEFPKNNLTRSL